MSIEAIKNFNTTPSRALSFSGKKKDEKEPKKVDILHDTPVRYFGYFDDIGAAIRVVCSNSKNALIKNLPNISYIPAGAYIGADVTKTYNDSKETDGKKVAAKKALRQGIFQTVTSILFPIAVVSAAQKALGKGFDKFIPSLGQKILEDGTKLSNRKRDVALVLGGLGALFAVSKPLDKFADKVLMNKIINPLLGLKPEKED